MRLLSICMGCAQANSVLMQMPWNDWQIGPDEIEVLQHEDGTDWKLGEGASGSVSDPDLFLTLIWVQTSCVVHVPCFPA